MAERTRQPHPSRSTEHVATKPASSTRGTPDRDPVAVPLWATVQAMERAFGTSFGGVRLKDDEASAARAASLGALAYTDGSEIGFADGAFDPRSDEGVRTIAHEFAHVVQARGGTPGGARPRNFGVLRSRRLDVAGDRDEIERQAEVAADDVVAGRPPDLDQLAGTGILRKDTAARPPDLAPGQTRYYRDDSGALHYVFRMDDIRAWGGRAVFEVLRRYFGGNYDLSQVPNREDFVKEFMQAYEIGLVQSSIRIEDPAEAAKPPDQRVQQVYDLQIDNQLHHKALLWVRLNHPEVTPHDQPQTEGGPPPPVRTFEPKGDLLFSPSPTRFVGDIPRYVAGPSSTVQATVHFDESDTDRAMLNYFPSSADFDWRVLHGQSVVATGPLLKWGEISYTVPLPKPWLYRVEVTVSSSRFTGGRRLQLHDYVQAFEEKERTEQVFGETLVGDTEGKPFERTEAGALQVRPGVKPKDLQSQVNEIDAMTGAIDELEKRGELDAEGAKAQRGFLADRRAGLVTAQSQLGDDQRAAYIVEGIFVGREDSRAGRVTAVMQRVRREVKGTKAYFGVTLFDLTLTPTEPVRHVGEAEAELAGRSPDEVFKELELTALAGLAEHWHSHNDYPYGTVKLAVGLLEKPGTLHTQSVDTYNWKRTAAQVGTGVAVVGGLALIGASAFTGGATAPIGVVILEAVTVTAGIAVAAYNINERIQKGTFKVDAQLVLDLAAAVPVFGQIGRWLGASKLLLNGMMLVTVAGTAVAMTVQTKDQLLAVEVRHSLARKPVLDQLDAAKAAGDASAIGAAQRRLVELDRERDKETAMVIGGAAVSGGLLLIQLGTMVAGSKLATGRTPRVVEPEPVPTTPKVVPVEPVPTTPKVVPTEPVPSAPKVDVPEPVPAPKVDVPEPVPKADVPEPVPKADVPEPVPAPKVDVPEPTPAPKVPEPEPTPAPKPVEPEPVPAPPPKKLTALEALQAKIEPLQKEIQQLYERLRALRAAQAAERIQLRRQTQAKQVEIDGLQRRRMASSESNKGQLDEQIAKAKGELETLEDRKLDLDNDVDEITLDIAAKQKEVAKARFPLTRDPADEALAAKKIQQPKLPTAGRAVGDTPNQQAQLEADLKHLDSIGAQDVRVNQWQVDGNGELIGQNRPDVQYTLGGKRYYIEYEQPQNPRGLDHAKRIIRNDPTGTVTVKLVPSEAGFVPGKNVQTLTYTLDTVATL